MNGISQSTKLSVAPGEYDEMIDTRIAAIRSQCDLQAAATATK
jgi:hypothetical protein